MLLLVATSAAGCGSTGPTSPNPPASAPPASTGPASAAPATSSPSAPSSVGSPSAASSAGAILADPSLLDALPAAAAGLKLVYDAETTASVMATDPTLARDAAAMATGLATPTGQATPEEFVIVNAVRLRDPGKDEDWFRAWRDSYDAAACAQAGGVTGHAESTIQGRAVFIGSCANGVFTYHTRIGDGGTLLSLTSIGPSRLGQKLLEQIAP